MTGRWLLVCVLLLAAGVAVGWLLGHWRAYAGCCDCCTCQTCTGIDYESVIDGCCIRCQRLDSSEPCRGCYCHEEHPERWTGEVDGLPPFGPATNYPLAERRHAVVLEPGPTIYPALAELAQDAMSEPESNPDALDSTFVSRVLLKWETEYPIPVGAP